MSPDVRQRRVLVLNATRMKEKISRIDELHFPLLQKNNSKMETESSRRSVSTADEVELTSTTAGTPYIMTGEGVVPSVEVSGATLAPESEDPHQHWLGLARLVGENYHDYDGFVVLQAVPTMVNAACMLSFLLENLGKPVVLTGSVATIDSPQSDWRRNFILATLFAAGSLTGGEDCCEVAIVFAEKVFRGNRTILESSTRLQPFASPNFPLLAAMQGNRMIASTDKFLPAPTGRLVAHTSITLPDVLVLTVTPAIRGVAMKQLVTATQAKALVILAYGAGNIPVRDQGVIEAAQTAASLGMVVVVCSQVRKGSVALGVYYTSGEIARVATGSADMTLEATVAKLKYLLGTGLYSPNEVRDLLATSLRGEITDRSFRSRL